jgi:hypothetical protein
MKVIKIILAVLAALWALALVPKLIFVISHSGDPLAVSRIAGSVIGIVLASAISLILFKSSRK